MTTRPTLGLIGAGKVGSTLAPLWAQAAYTITGIYSRTYQSAAALASKINSSVVSDPKEIVTQSDLIILAVPDDAIRDVAAALVDCDWQNKAVIHTSGAHSLHSLDLLAQRGAMTGSLHPAYPFAGANPAQTQVRPITFALEASDDLIAGWLNGLIEAVGGYALPLPPGSKALYHAALVIASNYTVTLYATAERLLTELGASPMIVANALNTLVGATVENLQQQGIPAALTGPLVRNDTGTIQEHLQALHQLDPPLVEAYKNLARLTYPLLIARGIPTQEIEFTLQQAE